MRLETHYGERICRCYSDRPLSVDEMLRQAASDAPNNEAVVDGGRRCTYGELNSIVDAVALGLVARGVKSGDRVAVLLGNRLEFAECFFGIIRAGAIAVLLDTRAPQSELQNVLLHAQATVLIHEATLHDRLPPSADVPSVMNRISVRGASVGSEPLENLYLQNGKPTPPLREDDPAVIVYTSGTSGRPKGVVLTHLSIVTSAMNYEFCWQLTARDRSVMALPVNQVTGLVAVLITMVRTCGTTIMARDVKPKALLKLAAEERMTYAILFPTMYNLFLLKANFADYDLSQWRVGAYGGAVMSVRTIDAIASKLPKLQLVNAYGATETTSPSTLSPLGIGRLRPDTVGAPVPSADIIILDESGCEVPRGKTGEVLMAGSNVAIGYWKDDENTRSAFVGGYWRSGDLGSLTLDGHLKILDRIKELINRGGYKVYSAEVEGVLVQHPDVVEALVIPTPDAVLGEKTHAVVHLAVTTLSATSLKYFCAERLSDYKVPDYVTIVHQALPRGANGKIQKRGILEWLASLDGSSSQTINAF